MYEEPFTVERGRAALTAILSALENQDANGRLGVAKEEAGNNMIKYHQTVFPICIEIQLAVISQFGFRPDGEGIIQFNQHIKLLEREDPEVARLALLVKNYLIPPLNMPAMNMPHPR